MVIIVINSSINQTKSYNSSSGITKLQSNLNGSNSFGTMKIRSRHG